MKLFNTTATETCARCGAELEWNERKMVFWNRQLKDGYIKWFVIGSRDMGKRKEFPQYKGKKLCQICATEVFTGEDFSGARKKGTPPKINPKNEAGSPPEVADFISDFAALKVALKNNGVVMSAFNCPKCNNMLDIPETGKVLICKHCGSPIKPNDIYEKIKQLM
jgi:hypothetical protein